MYAMSDRAAKLHERVRAFIDEHVYPNEATFAAQIADGDRWQPTAIIEELKGKAKEAGLWNLFLPESELGAGLTNLEYAPLAELMGSSLMASEAFNCSAPDTGNMEVLARYGTEEQKKQWLAPLLAGEIRSAFAMTEPAVASSDATNICARIERDGDDYVINGRKWWTSGAGDPRCAVYIFMGKTDPNASRHTQQSMILVPADAPGVTVDAPSHGVWLRRRAPRPHGSGLQGRAGAGIEHSARRRSRVRNRPRPARPGTYSFTACAALAPLSAPSPRCASARKTALRSARRWLTKAGCARRSRARGWKSTRRACSPCTRPTKWTRSATRWRGPKSP